MLKNSGCEINFPSAATLSPTFASQIMQLAFFGLLFVFLGSQKIN